MSGGRTGTPDRPPPAIPGPGGALAMRPMGGSAGRHALPPPSRQRRAPTPGALWRRRVAVQAAKLLLPVLALGLLAAIAFWPEIEGGGESSRVSFRRTVEPRPEALRVVNPRYRGLDEQGRPYTITAAVGQQVGAEEILDLTEPRGDILLNDGAWVFLRADTGRYDKARNRLTLDGNVTIYHDNGTMLRTDHALVLPAEGAAEGDSPVAAQGGFGTLTAEGFRLTERGAVVVFTGKARAVLESRP
jgi:lipopolysaccharide export system protein LptC